MRKELVAFERLLDIMDELRNKCPWDKSQTIESLRYLTIEETYELSDAIIENDIMGVCKELGDLMLHLVFYSKIASENNDFTITDVLNGICEKLIQRHPHIYGDVKVSNARDVKNNWEKIKLKNGSSSVLGGVPVSLPAMVKAYRIQEKVSGVGFDWEKTQDVIDKVTEELSELKAEIDQQADKGKVEDEFGDLIFALINYARFININPEDALERTNKKFIKRFSYIELQAKKSKRKIQDLTLSEMDVYWNESKLLE
ncbi:MAG: nucleoside triphosphate pyrophosphohydrolase [Bacteroidota bacterium]